MFKEVWVGRAYSMADHRSYEEKRTRYFKVFSYSILMGRVNY